MAVNMSGFDKNPFRVGDRVRVKEHVLRTWPAAFNKYLAVKYAVVTHILSSQLLTDMDNAYAHHEHFELYKELEETTMQQQSKTKRVRFTQELWEKWKDNGGRVIHTPTGREVLQLAYFPEATHRHRYVYLIASGTFAYTGTCDPLAIEIPITTKRIPFNPELKDAKVFIEGDMLDFNIEIKEWYLFSNGFVALLDYEDNVRIKHFCRVQMEIEEDV